MTIESRSLFRNFRGYLLLAFLLLIVCIAACLLGNTVIPPRSFLMGILQKDGYQSESIILYHLRIPRVIAGVLAGIGLSVSGVLLQSVTGNALAGPNIIGVNAGGGFCCIILLSFFPHLWYGLPVAAFLGAFITAVIIILVAKAIHATASTVILSGIACTAILNAGISFLSLLDADVLSSYNAFSIGGFSGVQTTQLIVPFIMIAGCLITSLILSRRIDLLCLGDTVATSLGVRTRPLRTVCLTLASAAAAAVVSYAGLLGFVGLVIPHIARRLCGNAVGPQLIVSSFVGAIIVVLADLIGRTLLAPTEIPVGILMALIGVPFFFTLLVKRRNIYD